MSTKLTFYGVSIATKRGFTQECEGSSVGSGLPSLLKTHARIPILVATHKAALQYVALPQCSLAMKVMSSPGVGLLELKKSNFVCNGHLMQSMVRFSPRNDAPTRTQLLCLYDDMQIVN